MKCGVKKPEFKDNLKLGQCKVLSSEVMPPDTINFKEIHTRLSCWMHFYLV